MADEVKFTEEELEDIKGLQQQYVDVQSQFGQISIARLNLRSQANELDTAEKEIIEKFSDVQKKERDLVDKLTKKYGEGNLDPKTGVFTKSLSDEKANQ